MNNIWYKRRFCQHFATLDDEAAINVYPSKSLVFEHIDFAILPYDNRYIYFDDVEVRRAVALCTDRQSIVDEIYAGYGEVSHTYISSSHPLYDSNSLTEWDFNPTLGKSKLDAAGWLVGADGWRYKNGQRFALTYQTTEGSWMRTMLASMFKEDMVACGIDISIEYLPPPELFADGPDGPVFGRQFDFAGFAWMTDITPPCSLWVTSQITGPSNEGFGGWEAVNNTGYSNASYDAACAAGNANLWGTSEYESNHQQAMQIWTNELPVLPMFQRVKTTIANSNLLGVDVDETEYSEFWNVGDWTFASEATATTADGGTVTSKDGRVSLSVAGGAFDEAVTLTHAPVSVATPDGLFSGGQAFELTAVNQSNGQPATLNSGNTFELTVTFSEEQLEQLRAGAAGLGLYYWDGNEWVLEPTSTVNLVNRTVTATPNHLSVWAIFSKNAPPIYLPLVEK